MEHKTDVKWFTDAKYGLFIHWGLYSILAGKWKGVQAPNTTEWIMRNMKIPLAEYQPLAKEFNPQHFDALDYVKKAKKWGMKYLCITTKHHDGFALFDTKVSDYNVMNSPYGKDIVKEFADACAAEGMPFCVYYSQMQDWEDPNGDGNNWDFNKEDKDFKKYFYGKCVPQVKELLTNYGKISMIWFDTPYDMPIELCRELRDVVKGCQPDCLINGRIGYGLGDYRNMADNCIPHDPYFGPWEAPMTLNLNWGYCEDDHNWAEPTEVIRRLSGIAAKGGNLILNIGPDKDGIIPEESVKILDTVGEWLEKNGESIFGVSATKPFPYDFEWGNATYNAETKRLYAHVLNYPKRMPKGVKLTGLKTKAISAKLLSTGEELKFSQTYEQARDERRFVIIAPENCPDATDTVLVVQLESDLETQRLDEGFFAVKQ